jgi:hypothetical protein
MANKGTVYNLSHVQVATIAETPTWIDAGYAVTLDPTISQDTDPLKADGATVVTSYSAPEGAFSLELAQGSTALFAILAGLTATTSGTTPSTIDRLDYLGDTTPPGVHLSAWAKNVDSTVTGAGMRVTLPNAKASVPSFPLGQETYASFTFDGVFNQWGTNKIMETIEFLESAPTFTSNVMPVNLNPPS